MFYEIDENQLAQPNFSKYFREFSSPLVLFQIIENMYIIDIHHIEWRLEPIHISQETLW